MNASPPLRAGLDALRAGRFREAFDAFRQGAEANDPEAWAYLGLLYLRGLGAAYDPTQAFLWTEKAERAGVAHAGLTLATLLYGGQGTEPDRERALELLRTTAARGHAPALRVLGLLHLGHGPQGREPARALLAAAARGGDGFALHALAVLHLEAGERKRGLPLLVAAARQGLLPARQRLRLLQKEYGAEETRALALLTPEPDTDDPKPALAAPPPVDVPPSPPAALLAEAIGLRRAEAVLHPLECDYLLALAAPFLRPAETADPKSGRPLATPLRTSLAANLHPSQEDLLALRIEEKILAVLGDETPGSGASIALGHCEPLAVLHYAPGQEYRPHFDAYSPNALRADPTLARSGQRTHTLLTYLNDACSGGGTSFPRLGLRIAPATGSVVLFRNSTREGEPLAEALHAGEPVATGEKWLATLWVREREGARLPAGAGRPS